MKLINSSTRNARFVDGDFAFMSKRAARKQLRAREKAYMHREMPAFLQELREVKRDQQQARVSAKKAVRKECTRLQAPSAAAVRNRLLVGRKVFVRYVGYAGAQERTIDLGVIASCDMACA